MSKITVGLIYGGKSTEYEVSLRSAKSVLDEIDKDKYNIRLIHVLKDGTWRTTTELSEIDLENSDAETLYIVPGNQFKTDKGPVSIDVMLPVLHGTYGEDGNVQGAFNSAGVAFVGCNTRSSAIAMDKDITKRLLTLAGIDVARGIVLNDYECDTCSFTDASEKLGTPMFIKPANQGSSVGVFKVVDEKEYNHALSEAFKFDTKVLIEEAIVGREIEVSVLGNEELFISVPGEIVSNVDFYDYESKYLTDDGATLMIPAEITEDEKIKIQDVAYRTFKTLDCEGFSRVDVFLTETGQVLVNEINTLPGFTSISMYPKLIEVSGISYRELLDELIHLALNRHEKEVALMTNNPLF
ncbi:D-alanine--D-alanine ligase family protein [Phocicoccus pinnipedialis]|uniref:D-alanine--D-alanine ligase n=1 Tax=Phocicoccus pinnipedialis TaxID=110845 RepID=A0A6V7R8Q9_9BACL|nr:D-alanine--D-alanine ligase family protein [Jeotgalicoccus pinnipedialis]MBP1940169.1 D-alanine-D-alanine ligase [Jeotgalicoccus pinnipedialis]CAD2073829.1 D-alanine--D-alanine ligase A [Jeotgalicoccus pinnipedialis]